MSPHSVLYIVLPLYTHTHTYIYLFCFMEGVTQEGNAQAGHRQGCGVRCAMYECVCGAGVCMQCVCKMGEHLHKARGAYMQGTSKAGACMHSVGACASCASMQTRDSNVHARCVCSSKVLVPKLPCPPSCRVTCCPCSALLLTSHSFCRIGATGITQQLGQQCIAGPAAQWGAMGSKEGAPRPWEGAQSARRVGGISVF